MALLELAAIKKRSLKIVKSILSWDELTPLWGRALVLACIYGHYEVVKLLLDKGFPLDLVHYGDVTALCLLGACKGGHCEVVELLLGRGAQVDYLAAEYESVLMLEGEYQRYLGFVGDWMDFGMTPLMLAIEYDHCGVVRLLLEKGAQVDFQDESGKSALMLASECRQWALASFFGDLDGKSYFLEVAELLLEKGAQVDLQDKSGKSALMLASMHGQCDVARLLLGKGAQVDLQDKSGRSAVMAASEYGNWNVGKLLLERGCKVDTATLSAFMSALMLEHQDSFDEDYISIGVVETKYLEEAKLLLLKGAEIDFYHEKGCQTLLWLACRNKNLQICQSFLEMCPWVERTPLWGGALVLACAYGHYEIVTLVLEKGFPQDLAHYGEISLLSACHKGHYKTVKLLLERGVQVDAHGDTGSFSLRKGRVDKLSEYLDDYGDKSALEYAAEGGHAEVVILLLDGGARAGLYPALTDAMKRGHRKVVEVCAEQDLLDDDGCSPLMFASKHGHYEMAKLLLVNIQDRDYVNLQGRDGKSALMFASLHEIVELLLENGAQVDLQDSDGMSALMFASSRGLYDIAKLFLEKGAQIDLQDSAGRSALILACNHLFLESGGLDKFIYYRSSFFHIVKTLLQKGAAVNLEKVNPTTLLVISCAVSNLTLISSLLEIDSSLVMTDIYEDSPALKGLTIACIYGQYDVVVYILEKGLMTNPQAQCIARSMACATGHGHCEIVKLLLDRGVQVDLETSTCYVPRFDIVAPLSPETLGVHAWVDLLDLKCKSPIMYATKHGHYEIVQLLLDRGAHVDHTVLELAIQKKQYVVVKLLLQERVLNWSVQLTTAMRSEQYKLVELFMENCDWKDLLSEDGVSPLMIASEHGLYEMAKLLLEKGARVDWLDILGRSALMLASVHGQFECVKLLLEKGGALIDLLDNAGRSALVLACNEWYQEVTKASESASKFYDFILIDQLAQ